MSFSLFRRKEQFGQTIKMVVGLGNPGSEYKDTRHNIGFMVVDALASQLYVEVRKKKFAACFGETNFEGKKLIMLKPWQYMNRSGQAVATAAGFYKLQLSDILVVTDDLALDPGRIRIRKDGSAGGHNGLKDIIAKLGSDQFARLRVGIGSAGPQEAYDYVLDKIKGDDKPLIDQAIIRAKDAVLCWLGDGIDKAMNEYNKT